MYSDGNHKVDTSFYTGSGGVAYVYSKLATLLKPTDQGKDLQDRFGECFSVNLDLIESGKSKRAFECPSFYQSAAGLYTLGAIHWHETGDHEKSKKMVESLVAMHEMLSSEEQEDEVLYGWAGHLYCLLSLIHKKV